MKNFSWLFIFAIALSACTKSNFGGTAGQGITNNSSSASGQLTIGATSVITSPLHATLTGVIYNIGGPVGTIVTPTWTQTAGDHATMSIDSSGLIATIVFPAKVGLYKFKLQVTNGYATVSKELSINIANSAPVVNAGTYGPVSLPNTLTLAPVVTDDGIPSTPALSYLWEKVGSGTVTFDSTTNTSSNKKNAVATFAAAGTYTLKLTVADGGGLSNFATTTIVVQNSGTTNIVQISGNSQTDTVSKNIILGMFMKGASTTNHSVALRGLSASTPYLNSYDPASSLVRFYPTEQAHIDNDDWATVPAGATVLPASLQPSHALESGFVYPIHGYTVANSSTTHSATYVVNAATKASTKSLKLLAEAYDITAANPGFAQGSVRGYIAASASTPNNVIMGLILSAGSPKLRNYFVRAYSRSIGGIATPLADPKLRIYKHPTPTTSVLIRTATDWNAGGELGLTSAEKDALNSVPNNFGSAVMDSSHPQDALAFITEGNSGSRTAPPGNTAYTIVVDAQNNSLAATGSVVIEVYDLGLN